MKLQESLGQHYLGMRGLTDLLNKVSMCLSWKIKCHPDCYVPSCEESITGTIEDVPQAGPVEAGAVDGEHFHFYLRIGKMKLLQDAVNSSDKVSPLHSEIFGKRIVPLQSVTNMQC